VQRSRDSGLVSFERVHCGRQAHGILLIPERST
jgi:hypothetical protein